MFAIANVFALVAAEVTQSALQVSLRLVSQLISCISSALQKLSDYFKGTTN